jgi:uncharacterized Ntn-hydrolase superfamily protein
MPTATIRVAAALLACAGASALTAQEPISWGEELYFHTFSIAAIDPATGEVGVAVTTRVPCVGNGVPWVRQGVGAVATQAFTRVAYAAELFEMLEQGVPADEALRRATAADSRASRRQVGVIALDGSKGQHTGDSTSAWAGHRAGATYVTQGNLLVGPQVLEAVAQRFEASEGSERHLADRLIEALWAGQQAGGDARKGRLQSAAVVVADSREGMSRRPDGITANVNVCEHPTPVAELRRIYDTISRTLGYRDLHEVAGNDVWQLRVMLHALGRYGAELDSIPLNRETRVYSEDLVVAVEEFRAAEGLSTSRNGSPRGLVDGDTVDRLWRALEQAGLDDVVRRRIRNVTRVRR